MATSGYDEFTTDELKELYERYSKEAKKNDIKQLVYKILLNSFKGRPIW